MSTKTLERADLKAVATEERTANVIEFYAVAFSSRPDKQGDRIDPGAVDEWLDAFYKAGQPLAISFTHAAVRNTSDPFAIVGYAPADPQHVWKDSYGLRVRAYLDTLTNDTAAQVYTLAKRGIVKGASVAYVVPDGGEKRLGDGSTLITRMEILEAGPCLDPANTDAFVVAVKAMFGDEVEVKAVDGSAWDGNRAMGQCSTAAEYRSICAGERSVGDPDERQHWALPHHYLGRGPNAAGVRNALARLPQTQGLTNRGRAESHLEAHMREVNPEREESAFDGEYETTTTGGDVYTVTVGEGEVLVKAGRKMSASRARALQAARDAINEILQEAGIEPLPDEKTSTEDQAEEEPEAADLGPNADLHEELAAIGE